MSEYFTFEQYLEHCRDEAAWIYDLHGEGGETYGLLFDVVPAGRHSLLEDEYELLLDKPLWIQRRGKKYNVYVAVYQD